MEIIISVSVLFVWLAIGGITLALADYMKELGAAVLAIAFWPFFLPYLLTTVWLIKRQGKTNE